MSLKRLNRVRRSIGFKLITWYSAIFVLSALLLFSLSYLSLSSSLHQKIREDLSSKVREYAGQYRAGGMENLMKEVALEKKSGKDATLFVRITGPGSTTFFVDDPEQWANIDLEQPGSNSRREQGFARLRTQDGHNTLDVESAALDENLVLQVGKTAQEEAALLGKFRETFVGFLVPVLMLAIAGGGFLVHRGLRPLRNLVSTIRSISPHSMDARVPATQTGDELDVLVTLFNAMLEKIEALIKGMRGSLDNVAHDLRTPMARLRGTAEMALQSEPNAGLCGEALADCVEEADRILSMLNTLMDISEAETGAMTLKFETVEISALMEEAVELYRHVAEDKAVALQVTSRQEVLLTADRARIRQVLANLLDNAIKYTPTGGTIELRASRQERQAMIVLRDTGIGIAPQDIPKIWDRLYRGDQSRSARGLGLGLSLVKAVVEAHRGRIEVSSEPGSGSSFTLYLPTAAA